LGQGFWLFFKKRRRAFPRDSSKSRALGLIWLQGTGVSQWLINGKVPCIITAWGLIVTMLFLNRMLLLKGKVRAYMTIAVFVLILFAIVLGSTQHDFTRYYRPPAPKGLASV